MKKTIKNHNMLKIEFFCFFLNKKTKGLKNKYPSPCLYKARQAAITNGGLFTDNGVDERGENERQSENYWDEDRSLGQEDKAYE